MSLIQPLLSPSSSDLTQLSTSEVLRMSLAKGESSTSRSKGPNKDQSSTPPSTFLPSSSSSSTLNACPTSQPSPPLLPLLNVIVETKAKPLASPPLFLQEVPPILSPLDSVSFDARLALELDQDPNLPRLEEGEEEGGTIEERIMGLLRSIHEESVGEGGGQGRTRKRRRGFDHQLGEELEVGRIGVERRRSSTRTEDGVFPKTPLEGGEAMVRLGEEGSEDGELGTGEKRSWAGGGGGEFGLGGERVEFGKIFGAVEGEREADQSSARMGDPVEMVCEEDEMEMRSSEQGVGTLWV